MAKLKKTLDMSRFIEIRNRIVDLYQSSGQVIREKRTLSISPNVFREQQWMVEQIEALASGPLDDADKPRYEKVKRFVQRVCADYADAIRGGEFIKVSAEIFGASRFLSRCLERIAIVIDEDAAEELIIKRMPDEKQARIELPLDGDIADTEAETEDALKELGGAEVDPDVKQAKPVKPIADKTDADEDLP